MKFTIIFHHSNQQAPPVLYADATPYVQEHIVLFYKQNGLTCDIASAWGPKQLNSSLLNLGLHAYTDRTNFSIWI
jgi:hypothetical protein